MFEPNVFFDRYGRQKFNDDIVPSHKKGYFVLLVKDDWVLLTIPPKQKVPEFPGGSILRGEDLSKRCLILQTMSLLAVCFIFMSKSFMLIILKNMMFISNPSHGQPQSAVLPVG